MFIGSASQGYIQVYETKGTPPPPYLFQCLVKDLNNKHNTDITYSILDVTSPFQIDNKRGMYSADRNNRGLIKTGGQLSSTVADPCWQSVGPSRNNTDITYTILDVTSPFQIDNKRGMYSADRNKGGLNKTGGQISSTVADPCWGSVGPSRNSRQVRSA